MRSHPFRQGIVFPCLFLLIAAAFAGAAGASSPAPAAASLDSTSAPARITTPFGATGALVDSSTARVSATDTVLHFLGTPTNPETPDCTGEGSADVAACDGPILSEKTQLGTGPAGHWDPPEQLDGTNSRNIYDPNWLWTPAAATTLEGAMQLKFWASCGSCSPGVVEAEWTIRIFNTDAIATTPSLETVVTATPPVPNVPSLLTANVTIPTAITGGPFVLHVDPSFLTPGAHIYYDSDLPCPGAAAGPCDSTVTVPVLDPTAVRVTTLSATRGPSGVAVRWRTAAETNVLGFNVWRGAKKLNRALVPASGKAGGAGYRVLDRTAKPGRSYAYRLQVVGRDGTRSWQGSTKVHASR